MADGRKYSWSCPNCGKKSMQDWEEPDECPYCDGEGQEPDTDDFPDYDDDYSNEALEWGGMDGY